MKTIEIYRNKFRNFSKFSKLIEIYRNFDHFSKFRKISKFWPKLIEISINFDRFRNFDKISSKLRQKFRKNHRNRSKIDRNLIEIGLKISKTIEIGSKFSKLIEINRNFDQFRRNFENDRYLSKFRSISIDFEKFRSFRNEIEIFASKRNFSKFRFEKWDRNEMDHFDQFRNILLKGHTSVPDHLQQVFTLKTRLKQEASLSNNSCSCS